MQSFFLTGEFTYDLTMPRVTRRNAKSGIDIVDALSARIDARAIRDEVTFALDSDRTSITAGLGDDYFEIRRGDNLIDGGRGRNAIGFIYAVERQSDGIAARVTIDLRLEGSVQTNGDLKVTLTDIRDVQGSHGRDTIIGDQADNILNGGNFSRGGDTLGGGGGSDTLIVWGTGNVADGGDGDDIIYSRSGLDSDSGDRLNGNAGNDRLTGGGGDDILRGGIGDDILGNTLTS